MYNEDDKKQFGLYFSEEILNKYPRTRNFLNSPAYKKSELVCLLMEKYFNEMGLDGYVKDTSEIKSLVMVLGMKNRRG